MVGRLGGLFRRRGGAAERQAGAIPYVVRDGVVVVLLITSRRTGRWIFPKGGLVDGLDEPQSAALEAWEEAGVKGEVAPTCLGLHRSRRVRGAAVTPLEIAMYPLRVKHEAADWPEKRQRKRRWVPISEARRLVRDRDLRRMIDQVARDAAAWP